MVPHRKRRTAVDYGKSNLRDCQDDLSVIGDNPKSSGLRMHVNQLFSQFECNGLSFLTLTNHG